MAMTPDPDPQAPGAPDADTLPCGTDLADLWEHGEPQPDHRTCPHCRRALADLDQLHDLIGTALTQPEPPAPPSLADRIMETVRTELRPGPLLPLGRPEDDDWITESAAARVLRHAAETLPGILAGRCHLRPADGTGERPLPGTRLPRRPLALHLDIAITTDWTTQDAARAVRRRVARAGTDELGVTIERIDVTVADVIAPTGEPNGSSNQ
ncbi:hypothetical protein [Kitasatospora sp. LaBMicrA B282]|uniref:hypothetical protein n=1 Tax=Kitasatospora sp. LaBMicrA B282 TaxID=3420949 RepID=UPI003D0CC345